MHACTHTYTHTIVYKYINIILHFILKKYSFYVFSELLLRILWNEKQNVYIKTLKENDITIHVN